MVVETIILFQSFLLGLSASFAPCLFPVLPTFMAYLIKDNEGDENTSSALRGTLAALSVVLGIMTVFFILNLILSVLGNQLNLYLSSHYLQFRFIQGAILVILGILLAMKLDFNFGFLSKFTTKSNEIITSGSNPYIQSFLIGLFFAVLAAPCAFIVFFTYFSYIIANPGFLNAILLTLAFSFGAGIPFFILGGLVPELKSTVLDHKTLIFKYLPIITGLIIAIVGVYLMLDAQKAIQIWFSPN